MAWLTQSSLRIFPVWLDLSKCLVSRRVVIAEHLNMPHIVSGDGAAPCNFPCLLLHGFAGLVVVDATVRSMCCFPDKEFHMRKPLGVHFTSVAVLGQDHLVGLVVKASASRAEGPGFESRLRRDFFGVESYQWLKNWHSSGYPARRLAL